MYLLELLPESPQPSTPQVSAGFIIVKAQTDKTNQKSTVPNAHPSVLRFQMQGDKKGLLVQYGETMSSS